MDKFTFSAMLDDGGDRNIERRYLQLVSKTDILIGQARGIERHERGRWAVYFLFGPVTQRVKIGTSQHLYARFFTLCQNASEPYVFLGWIPGGRAIERVLHDRLASSRVYGEWFNLTPEVLAELARFEIDPLFR